MNVKTSTARRDELSVEVKTGIASRMSHALVNKLGNFSRKSTKTMQKDRGIMPLLAYEALERQNRVEEAMRHQAFLNARW